MSTKSRAGIASFLVIAAVAALLVARSQMPASVGKTVPQKRFIDTVSYSCDAGKAITAAYYDIVNVPVTNQAAVGATGQPIPTGSVDLILSDGRTMTLAQTISADGVRYANPDESFVFWSRGNGALVLEHNVTKSYIGCIAIAPEPAGSDLSRIYSNSQAGFSIRLPGTATSSDAFTIDSAYTYQALGPGHDISGVKFTIPKSVAAGTNLSVDSYISVEQVPKTSQCSAGLFMNPGIKPITLDDGGTAYSVATSTDAAAGNRYEETVYAFPGTNPCIAVRYFVHYGAFENYPSGTIQQFDRAALLDRFDQIRRTLVLSQ